MSCNADLSRPIGKRPELRFPALLMAMAMVVAAAPASARTTDRNQPMDIDAGRQSGTLSGDGVTTLSGGVHITQGSLDIRSNGARITLANRDPVRAVFDGAPVVLTQILDDGTPMTARANSVDYNLKTEVVTFTGNVSLQQPSGTLSGQHVVYNLKTSSMDGGGEGNGRVQMRILPSGSKGNTATKPGATQTPARQAPTTTRPGTDAPAATEPAAADKGTD